MMEFLFLLLVLALIAVVLWVTEFIAREFSAIAHAKGYDERRYWHVAFWLGLVGYLIIIGLPDKNTRDVQPVSAAPITFPETFE